LLGFRRDELRARGDGVTAGIHQGHWRGRDEPRARKIREDHHGGVLAVRRNDEELPQLADPFGRRICFGLSNRCGIRGGIRACRLITTAAREQPEDGTEDAGPPYHALAGHGV
jgi:hypothetical protein